MQTYLDIKSIAFMSNKLPIERKYLILPIQVHLYYYYVVNIINKK